MSFQAGVDRISVNGAPRPVAFPIAATVGDVIEIVGWAVDKRTNRGAERLVMDPAPDGSFVVRTGFARPELAAALGEAASNCGFVIELQTASLRPMPVPLRLVMPANGAPGWSAEFGTLELTRPDGSSLKNRQIVTATAMKSGGRHVASMLAKYFGIESATFGGAFPSPASDAEHLLTRELLQPALDAPFVLCLHLAARAVNINAIKYWGLNVVVTWRNLGDVVVSLDDHIRTEPDPIWRNVYAFMDYREPYAALPEQQRYRYQIRNALPWYFSFYVGWRLVSVPLFMRYEWMVRDELAYFTYLIEQLEGTVDEARLRSLVAAGPTAESGFNVGLVGRSATQLDEATQTMLEDCIREYPSDVGELLFELPWYAAKYGAPQLVATSPTEIFLVAEGKKRRASAHWLHTHGVGAGQVQSASPADLAGFPEAAPLF